MRLKRLELQGYKSFASRTEFVFPSGITAIVGPNGSGKSNIADAIRWALGEQSLRSLRGKTGEDMIFSGGQRRARAGMAEVLLTLDNSDGGLPVEYTEVTLGRRAYRSGENEYLINGARVRLRDIVQLLAESGLSQRTYAVIGQGLVDAALSLRPQERRALFEEAAGISVYRQQREESLTRLEETARNLDRVRDILSETTPRLRRLEEQVERLQEHERVSAHLLRLQRTWYGYLWGQAQTEVRDAQERATALEEQLSTYRTAAEEASRRLATLRQQQAELRAALRDDYRLTADLHDRANAAQREQAALAERVRLLTAQGEETAQQIGPLHAQQQAQAERVRAAEERAAAAQQQMQAEEVHLAALERETHRLRLQAQEQAARQAQAQHELAATRTRREQAERSLADLRAARARLEAEQELLARLRQEQSGLNEGMRTLLRADLPGAQGLLSGLLRVPTEWEKAVEAALGARLQALVVHGWPAVEAARTHLEHGARALLVLRDTPPPQHWDPPPGALRAADVVTAAPDLRPTVEALLGRTLLVEDLEAARRLQPVLPPGGQVATRDGEVFAADGTVALGSGDGGVLAQERAWQTLPQRLEDLRRQQEALEADLTHTAERAAVLEAALQEASQQATQTAQALTQAESGPLAQARTRLALARQEVENQRTLLQKEKAALERLNSQIASHRARLESLKAERTAAEQRLAQLQQETQRSARELAETRSRIAPAEERLGALGREQEQAEEAERQAQERFRRAEEMAVSARLELARSQDRLTRLQERIEEDLGLVELEVTDQVTARTPLPLHPFVSALPTVEALPEGLQEEIGRLKARLRQIGPVNPNAVQDYEENAQRHRFLSEQLADLEAASARLHEVVAELDRMMEQAFRETFDAVAAAFEETFTTLFNGGTAHLELTEPDDLLNSGVDIVARPPGKRLQSLALLSGGERALTAAALIFAILRVRPTPLCVLDEVDAMLDESNVARFRRMLEDLSQKTQFIVITHNRATVEAAATVYGVSMGSEGVSQVVSLRMEEVVE
jgi:chromosome segregation protein